MIRTLQVNGLYLSSVLIKLVTVYRRPTWLAKFCFAKEIRHHSASAVTSKAIQPLVKQFNFKET